MQAVIEQSASGKSWSVRTGKGIFDGFGSYAWAEKFAWGMGYTIIACVRDSEGREG